MNSKSEEKSHIWSEINTSNLNLLKREFAPNYKNDIRQFPLQPKIFEGEDPTSWMVRLATANTHTLVSIFTSECININKQRSKRNVSNFIYTKSIPREFIEILLLRQTQMNDISFLSPYPELAWNGGQLMEVLKFFPFIPSPSHEKEEFFSRKIIHTPRYCPECLKEDDIPYFRIQWRLPFYFFCDKHLLLFEIIFDKHIRCFY